MQQIASWSNWLQVCLACTQRWRMYPITLVYAHSSTSQFSQLLGQSMISSMIMWHFTTSDVSLACRAGVDLPSISRKSCSWRIFMVYLFTNHFWTSCCPNYRKLLSWYQFLIKYSMLHRSQSSGKHCMKDRSSAVTNSWICEIHCSGQCMPWWRFQWFIDHIENVK